MKEARCEKCNSLAKPRLEHEVAQSSPLAAQSLKSLGIPAYDIVRVTDGEREECFLLGGDRK